MNIGSKLVINGFLSAGFAVTSEWTVFSASNVPIDFAALTPKIKTFTAVEASTQITFPLSINPNVFTGGSVYSFRLTARPFGSNDVQTQTFTQIILTANSPPTGGYVSASPTTGDALVTEFLISSPGWTADVANFPLNFAFAYQLTATSPLLIIATLSLRAFSTTTLPAGAGTQKNLVTLQGQAQDVFLSSSVATATVAVTLRAGTNITNILTSSVSKGLAQGNVNLVFQTINNVSYLPFTFH